MSDFAGGLTLGLLVATGLVLLWLLVTGRFDRRNWLEEITCEEVVVHTENETVRGMLTLVTAQELVLSRAAYVQGGNEVPLEGELGIPRDKIAFVQRRAGK